MALNAVMENDHELAREIIDLKSTIADLAKSGELHLSERLVVDEPNRLEAYTLEIEVIEKQKRIYYFAKRIAKAVLPEDLVKKED
jgi:phosphate:Na+ symporter